MDPSASLSSDTSLHLVTNISSVGTLNVTSVPIIHCPLAQTRLVRQALDAMKYGAALANQELAQGVQSVAYEAMFKSVEYKKEISQLFRMIEQLPSLRDPKPLDYVCIRTKQDADRYTRSAALSAKVWNACQKPTVRAVNLGNYNRMYFCEQFFTLPIDTEQPQRQACPWVFNNKFVDNGNGQRFRTSQNIELLQFHLRAYRRNLRLETTTQYLDWLNLAVGTSIDLSPDSAINFHIYSLRKSNRRSD